MRLSEDEVVVTVGNLTVHELQTFVAEGWIAPAMSERGQVFDDVDIARIRLVCHLRQELAVDDDTLPVILSLIDQIHGLRHELSCLLKAIEAQPERVRTDIAAAFRHLVETDPT